MAFFYTSVFVEISLLFVIWMGNLACKIHAFILKADEDLFRFLTLILIQVITLCQILAFYCRWIFAISSFTSYDSLLHFRCWRRECFSISISPFINASKSTSMPNFSILLLLNFYLMRIYIINFTPSFKMLKKETFRFSIFFFIKKSSSSMSNFINLVSLLC